MMRPVRLAALVVSVGIVLAGAWTAWQAWHVSKSLSAAADDAARLQSGLDAGDQDVVDASLSRLADHAQDADARTGGPTWGALTHLPFVGDDARGVRVVSSVLADLTDEGFRQLADSAGDLSSYLPQDGAVPLDAVEQLRDPVDQASTAFARADERLAAEDTTGYVGPLRTNYDELATRVADARKALATADRALGVLPTMLGSDGPRSYLMIFQNNAEARATGGLPGAWALVTADDGRLSITRQGVAADFPALDGEATVAPVTAEEEQVYGPQLGQYFQDANFTPDFPRTAELWHAWWDRSYPQVKLDGVVSFDPVAMSYLLPSTGPVRVGAVTLNEDNAVEELLSKPYLTSDSAAQDVFFAQAARALFDSVTGSLTSPMGFLRALQRGTDEGRVHLAAFSGDERSALAGTELEGALPGADAGPRPQVEVTVNDATGSKMSYYLRYHVDVTARSCAKGGTQTLLGSMSLSQSIPAAQAATLPTDVTGGGLYGTEPGKQLVIVRIYGPAGGTVSDLKLDGTAIDSEPVVLDGRPVTLVVTELSGPDDVLLTWGMTTGAGQPGDGVVGVTPSVVPGSKSSTFASAC